MKTMRKINVKMEKTVWDSEGSSFLLLSLDENRQMQKSESKNLVPRTWATSPGL